MLSIPNQTIMQHPSTVCHLILCYTCALSCDHWPHPLITSQFHHLMDSKFSFNFSCCFNNFEFSLRSDSNSLVSDSLSEISFFRLLSFSIRKGFESIIFDRKTLTSKSTSFVSAVAEHLVAAASASDPTLSHSFLSPPTPLFLHGSPATLLILFSEVAMDTNVQKIMIITCTYYLHAL